MNPKAVLVVLLNVEYIYGFGKVPDGRGNAVELSRSPCQDIFFGKGGGRTNPLKPDSNRVEDTTICGQIAGGARNHNVRVSRQNEGTAKWCNDQPRIGKEDECHRSYALIGRFWVPCKSDVLGRCRIDPSEAQEGCRESPAVCSLLRAASEVGGPDIVELGGQSFHWQCSLLTDKETCNARVFTTPGSGDGTDVFYTCTWNGATCSGLGPHTCSAVEGQRQLGEDKQLQSRERQLQDEDACTAQFSTQETCDNGYVYSSGFQYDYLAYSSTNLPPDLAICEWSEGACRTSRTCPYMCELTSDRAVDVEGISETDATLTFGDGAITGFCEASSERRLRQDRCEEAYRVENTESPLAPKQVVACRYAQGNVGFYCTREDREGFAPCI